jgi:hypothetical protein
VCSCIIVCSVMKIITRSSVLRLDPSLDRLSSHLCSSRHKQRCPFGLLHPSSKHGRSSGCSQLYFLIDCVPFSCALLGRLDTPKEAAARATFRKTGRRDQKLPLSAQRSLAVLPQDDAYFGDLVHPSGDAIKMDKGDMGGTAATSSSDFVRRFSINLWMTAHG